MNLLYDCPLLQQSMAGKVSLEIREADESVRSVFSMVSLELGIMVSELD